MITDHNMITSTTTHMQTMPTTTVVVTMAMMMTTMMMMLLQPFLHHHHTLDHFHCHLQLLVQCWTTLQVFSCVSAIYKRDMWWAATSWLPPMPTPSQSTFHHQQLAPANLLSSTSPSNPMNALFLRTNPQTHLTPTHYQLLRNPVPHPMILLPTTSRLTSTLSSQTFNASLTPPIALWQCKSEWPRMHKCNV